MAAQRQPMQFAPESQLQTLSRIAPGINALRGVQQQQMETAEAVRKQQAYQQFQTEVARAFPGGVRELARVFMTQGTTPQHFEVGQKLMQTAMEEEDRQRIFGGGAGGGGGAPAMAERPAAMPAAAPETVPEMGFGAAGGARPVNAMTAQAAPAKMLEYAGRQYSPDQVGQMLQSRNPQLQQLGRAIADANKPQGGDKDEVRSRMRAMGLPETQEGFAQYFRITQPQLGLSEQRFELEKQRAEMDRLRFQASQARSEADARTAQRNLALAERRYELSVRQFELTSDPGYQARLAAVKTTASETAKSDVAALSEAPVALEQGQRALALLNRMVGNPKGRGAETQPHPGFQGVVGATLLPGARLVQGTSEADFDAMLEQVLGGAFLEAYERLKGTGQITEIEGKKATQAISRMGRAVSEAEFMQAAKEFRSALETAMERTSTRLERARTRTEPPVPQANARPPAAAAPASAAPAGPPAGRTFPPPPQAAIDALRRGQGTDAQFDAIFGPGAAAKARGR